MADYEGKFIALSWFILELVNTEVKKCKKFEEMLKMGLKNKVVILKMNCYTDLVDRTMMAECH